MDSPAAAQTPKPSLAGDGPHRLLLAASVLVPLLFFVGVAIVDNRNQLDDARSFLARTADLMQEQAAGAFDTAELLARSIQPLTTQLTDEQIVATAPTISAYLEDLTGDYEQFFSAAIIDQDGRPLVSARTYPIPPGIDLSDRDYFIALRDNPDMEEFVSQVLRTAEGDTFFQLARARRAAGGEFQGLVTVSFRPEFFQAIYARFAGDTPLIAALVKSDGFILALHPYPEVRLDEAGPLEDFATAIDDARASGGTMTVDSAALGNLLVTFRQVGDRPIYIAAAFPLSAVWSQWRDFMLLVLAALGPITIALFVLSLVALRRHRERALMLESLRSETARRETAESGLRQAQKMEAIGQLSGGIAHDFNNLMTAIGGYLDLLKRKLSTADPSVSRYIDSATEAVRSAAKLTQRLLAFARKQPLHPEAVNINALVSGMSDLLHRTLGDAISVELVLGAGLWQTFVDGSQLESALLNLAINGRDAMPDGGKLTVETSNTYLDQAYIDRERVDDILPGQFVLLAVTDTGTGMSAETAAKVFDPFFTTKAPGQGTGLGLSMVHGFVRQSGGHVKIYSELGEGTTIKIYLPRLAADQANAGSTPQPAVAAKGSRTGSGSILVVEDDARVLEFERETLAAEGYSVLEATTGTAAIRILESATAIDLVLTDVVLPEGVSGRAVSDAAKRIRPGVPVLFTTGYTANAIVHQGRLDPDVVLLPKPFSAQDLLTAVAKLMPAVKPVS